MRTFKKILIITGVLLALLLITINIIFFTQKDEIEKVFAAKIRAHVTGILLIGKITGSGFFKEFPYASIQFRDIKIIDTLHTDSTFLEADAVSLLLNIRDIIKKNYRLKKIIIDEATVSVFIDEKGNPNYKVFRPRSESQDSSFSLAPG